MRDCCFFDENDSDFIVRCFGLGFFSYRQPAVADFSPKGFYQEKKLKIDFFRIWVETRMKIMCFEQ